MTREECNRFNTLFNSLESFKEQFAIGNFRLQPHVMHITDVDRRENIWHDHRTYEYSYLLEGGMDYVFDDGKLEVAFEPGDALIIPAETRHHWQVRGGDVVIFGFMLYLSSRGEGSRLELERLRNAIRRRHYRLPDFREFGEVVERILSAARKDSGYLEEKLRCLVCEAFIELFNQLLPPEKPVRNVSPGLQLRGSDPRNLFDAVRFYIADNVWRAVTPAEVGRHVGLSLNRLNTVLRQVGGETVGQMIWGCKMTFACDHLTNTNRQIKDIAASLGVEDVAYFCRRFRQHRDCSPEEYRRANRR